MALIETSDVLDVLQPIWRRIPETANRLRGRIEVILDWCKVQHFRDGENPARWRGHLALMFPATGKLKATRHHAAVPVDALPGVYRTLARSTTIAAAATRFAVLAAARPGEVVGATWDEIDLAHRCWTVPPQRQKARKPHRVPLSDEAIAILDQMAALRAGPHALVFPGARQTGRSPCRRWPRRCAWRAARRRPCTARAGAASTISFPSARRIRKS